LVESTDIGNVKGQSLDRGASWPLLELCFKEAMPTFSFPFPSAKDRQSMEGNDTHIDEGEENAGREGQLIAVEVARCAVQAKQVEMTTLVEMERLRQTGSTERLRLVEESRSHRIGHMASVAKAALEQHHITERERISSRAETERAAIAAQAREAELQALQPRPRPILSHWLLLWMLFGQRQGAAPPAVSTMAALVLLRQIWGPSGTLLPSSTSALGIFLRKAWRKLLALAMRRTFGSLQETPRVHSRELTARFSVESQKLSASIPASSSKVAAPKIESPALQPPNWSGDEKKRPLGQDLTDPVFDEYAEVLQRHGYDREVLADLKEEDVEEMLRLIECKPGHRVRFRAALRSTLR
ncbi:unnamed protein product, partial [Polarella glacialis]